jgi:hypothetical protein
MKKTSISVTDAARNFADCINRVRYQNVTFVLLRNGAPVACLAPPEEKSSKGADLARALSGLSLPPPEAAAWSRDLKKARKSLRLRPSKWE